MTNRERLKIIIWLYPIALTFIGVIIHAIGIFGFQIYLTTDFILHLGMLVIDLLAVISLCQRRNWGYWLAVFLYCQQSIFQPYWAYRNFSKLTSSLPHLVAVILIIISLFILIQFKALFYNNAQISPYLQH